MDFSVSGITQKNPEKYRSLVVRLGGFHIAENFMGCIGFFMKDSGIEDILMESGVCKRGTANKVIAGKDYYKMVRCHSLLSEAMIGLLWNAFQDWLELTGQIDCIAELCDKMSWLLDALEEKKNELTRQHMDQVRACLPFISQIWDNFTQSLGITGKYWLMYIEMVQILKRYIHAERAGLWLEHIQEVQNMLPFMVSAKHTRYISCVPLYLKDMRDLPDAHPDVYENFMKGYFTVHRSKGKFNGVWSDMALEQTYNNEGKTSLFKGISQAPAARDKYIKTVPFLTAVSESIKSMADLGHQGSTHHGETQKQATEDHMVVEEIKKVVCQQMINPFQYENKMDLLNIATGEKAVSTDLVHVRAKGMEAIVKAEREGSNKIQPPKIVTFSSQKTKPPPKKQSLVRIYQDETAITRVLCFYQDASPDKRQIAFSHEWTKYPSSLFEVDPRSEQGFAMRKGHKSDFLAQLIAQSDIQHLQQPSLPESELSTVFLIDAMAFVNRYQTMGAKSFDELQKMYFCKLMQLKPDTCNCINIIGDRYDFDDSQTLKGEERQRRNQTDQSREFSPSKSLDIPDWNLFIKKPKNKANLLNFLGTSICNDSEAIPDMMTIILGGMMENKSLTLSITSASTLVLDLLCEEHEEADTRIMAHLAYCVNHLNHNRAVIHATDTDIVILCMYHFCRLEALEELWIQRHNQYLPIHILVDVLSQKCQKDPLDVTATLLCTYVLSGCDTVSYPFRRGKRRAAKVSLGLIGSLPHLVEFGSDGTIAVTECVINEARVFWTALYGQNGFDSLDTLRQHMFVSSKSDIRSLPATEDAFYFHVLRSLYQILLYKRAHLSDLALPPVTTFGRTILNGKLIPILMSKPAKPNIDKVVFCKCKLSRCLKGCSCRKASVPCSVICTCLGQKGSCGRFTSVSEHSSSDDDDDA